MSSIEEISGRKRRARNLYHNLLGSPFLAALPGNYIGPAGLTKRDIIEKIERLGTCCQNIHIAEMQSGKVRIHKGDFCKAHIICGTCANRIQNLRRKRFTPAIKALAERASNTYNGKDRVYVYLVTFTIPDGLSIFETHKRLKAAMLKFRKMGQDRPIYKKGVRVGVRPGSGEWSKVIAAAGTHEIIRGDAGGVHSHCHMIVFTSSPFDYRVYDKAKKLKLEQIYGRGNIPKAELKKIENPDALSKITAEWKAADGDAVNFDVTPMYHIPRPRPGKGRPVKPETIALCAKMSYSDSIAYQAREVLKYAAKVESQDTDFSIRLIDETANKRFFEAFGLFRGISDDNNYNESEIQEGDQIAGIYKITWNDKINDYNEKIASDDPGIDDQFIGIYGLYRYKQNQIVGRYRTDRAALRAKNADAYTLNARRDSCRQEIKTLWASFKVDKMNGAYIKAIGLEYKPGPIRYSYDNFILMNFDPVRREMLREVFKGYINKKVYEVTQTEKQKQQENELLDW